MLGVTEIAKILNTKMAEVEFDGDNNKLKEGENGGGKMLSLKATDINFDEELPSSIQNNDLNILTNKDDGYTQENNASHDINEGSSLTNASYEINESCAVELQESQRTELQVLKNGAIMTTDNSPLQQVEQDLYSAHSSDEEIFSKKPKPKKAILLDDDVFGNGLDDVNLDVRNDRIPTDHKCSGNLKYNLFDYEDGDSSYPKKKLAISDAGLENAKGNMANDKIKHGRYKDIFDSNDDEDDDEVDRNEQDERNYTISSDIVGEKEEDFCDEADDVFDAEESEEEKVESKKKKRHKEKKEKPHRVKKADVKQIHSESQRMLRESTVKLPYHMPAVKPITHFLSRVPQVNKIKSKERLSKKEPAADEHKSSEGTSETTPKANGSRCQFKDLTPTLSKSADFIDLSVEIPPHPKPVNMGLQKLMERFAKHSSPKLQPNMDKFKPVVKEEIAEKNAKEDELDRISPARHKHFDPLVPEEKVKELKTPGARLQVLKEKLQQKMKVQRAELRKIQESQRKLDNEELSEEEDEEEELTDEEDSDYELEKWNIDDERKQEEGENENGEDDDNKDGNVKKSFNFVGEKIDSGSEGDVSDIENDKESVFSDKVTNTNIQNILRIKKATFDRNSNTVDLHGRDISPLDRHSPDISKSIQFDDRTMDLFGSDSRSRNDTQDSLINNSEENLASLKLIGESNGRFDGLYLRLDSFEDENTNGYSSYTNHNSANAFTKIKGTHKIDERRSPVNISEASQDSIFDRRLSSDFDASNDSSRIPAGQGERTKRNYGFDSDRKTPELFPSSLTRLQSLFDGSRVGKQGDGETSLAKTPGKLSQLTLPVEDSQDLFYDEDENKTEDDNQSKCASESTQDDFHFTLDEDTQFTQLLDTQGFINSSKKTKKPKPKTLFESSGLNSVDPMEELLGLCSGKFTEPGSTQLNRDDEEQVDKMDDDEEEEEDNTNNEEVESDVEGDEKDEELDNATESESDEELDYEEKLQRRYNRTHEQPKKKLFDRANFLEEEAELSGSDVGSDDDDDGGESADEYEEEENDEVLPSNKELQKQINKVHMKTLLDEDKAELRLYKEMYLPDGDLYSDGGGRTRNFRWRGIDDSQLNLFDNKALWGDEEGFNLEEASSEEEEIKKRKERYEREIFLREEMNKKKDDDIMDIDENSQTILNKIKNTSNAAPAGVQAPEQKIPTPLSTGAPKVVRLPSQKGSFLNRSKQTLSKLSAITANTPSASAATRAFVFQTVSPAAKTSDQGKRVRRCASMLDTPSAKRAKLDRSTSHTPTGSVFSML